MNRLKRMLSGAEADMTDIFLVMILVVGIGSLLIFGRNTPPPVVKTETMLKCVCCEQCCKCEECICHEAELLPEEDRIEFD